MDKINLNEKFALFSEQWSQKTIGEINDYAVKIAKVQGEFIWHHHDWEDEFFLVIKGRLHMQVREPDGTESDTWIGEGECIIIPHGVEHCPCAEEETYIMLLEPKETVNTGTVQNERTVVPKPL